MKKLTKWLVLLCILLAACGDMSLRDTLTQAVAAAKVNGLFMTGFVQISSSDPGLSLPCYWKNQALTLLPTGSQTNGAANGPSTNGSDIYIAGFTLNGTTKAAAPTTETPVYWKNGALSTLPLPAGTYGFAKGVGFDSAGNMYVSGSIRSISTGYEIPGYWKNGVWVPLSMTLPNGTSVNGSSNMGWGIDSSNNVFFCGFLQDPITSTPVPVYWKNGAVNIVSLASLSGTFNGGAVTAVEQPPNVSSLTILLQINDLVWRPIPAYMVNGVITVISTGSGTNGQIWWTRLSSSGDSYTTGMVGWWSSNPSSTQPAVWKNWVLMSLPTPNGQPYGWAGAAQMAGSDVYIDAGLTDSLGYGAAVYWKNGTLNVQPNGGYYGASDGGFFLD